MPAQLSHLMGLGKPRSTRGWNESAKPLQDADKPNRPRNRSNRWYKARRQSPNSNQPKLIRVRVCPPRPAGSDKIEQVRLSADYSNMELDPHDQSHAKVPSHIADVAISKDRHKALPMDRRCVPIRCTKLAQGLPVSHRRRWCSTIV